MHAHLQAFLPASELCFLVMFSFPRCSKFQIFQDCSAAYISFNANIFLVAVDPFCLSGTVGFEMFLKERNSVSGTLKNKNDMVVSCRAMNMD